MPLEEFFLDYGKQDRAPGEFVETIILPKPVPGTLHAAYKLSKRRDEDISAVALGMALTVADGTITGARLAFWRHGRNAEAVGANGGGADRPALHA